MKIECVVPVSGGKDSQACLVLALRVWRPDQVLGLFNDTQFEHPLTYEHIERMRGLYGVRIEAITAGSVPEKVRKYKRFPGGGARHCTEELKIVPSKKFYKAMAERHGGFQVWMGMRAAESGERSRRYAAIVDDALYEPHEIMRKYPKYLGALGVRFALPVLEWSTLDVLELLDGNESPLYAAGFDRVGCFPCLAAGDQHKARAFNYDEFGREQFVIVQQLERDIGKSVWTSKRGEGGCMICSM